MKDSKEKMKFSEIIGSVLLVAFIVWVWYPTEKDVEEVNGVTVVNPGKEEVEKYYQELEKEREKERESRIVDRYTLTSSAALDDRIYYMCVDGESWGVWTFPPPYGKAYTYSTEEPCDQKDYEKIPLVDWVRWLKEPVEEEAR